MNASSRLCPDNHHNRREANWSPEWLQNAILTDCVFAGLFDACGRFDDDVIGGLEAILPMYRKNGLDTLLYIQSRYCGELVASKAVGVYHLKWTGVEALLIYALMQDYGVTKPLEFGYRFNNINNQWVGGFFAGTGAISIEKSRYPVISLTRRAEPELLQEISKIFGGTMHGKVLKWFGKKAVQHISETVVLFSLQRQCEIVDLFLKK